MQPKQIAYFSLDGFESGIHVYRNEDKPLAEVVLCLPAMGTKAAFYSSFAEDLVEAGFHVVTADWRGKGLSALRASRQVDFGYREILEQDFPALFDCIRAEFPENQILVYGHSLGGQLGSIYLASKKEAQVEGIVLHFSCHCYYQNWEQNRAKFYRWFKVFPWIAKLYGYFPGEKFGFARREARTFMRDWGYSGIHGKYHPKGIATDYDSRGPQLKVPILAFSLAGDELAPRKGLEHLYSLFPNAPVQHYHIEPSLGRQKPFSHFNWVYQSTYFIEQLREWREKQRA